MILTVLRSTGICGSPKEEIIITQMIQVCSLSTKYGALVWQYMISTENK